MPHNAPHHLPAEAGEARCSRSGACGCWASLYAASTEVLLERLSSLTADEQKQLILRHADDSNALPLCFPWQELLN